MAYTTINWENSPSSNTPINAHNLNKMDKGIEDAHEELKKTIPSNAKGQPNGVATLDENGKIPSNQLPEIKEYESEGANSFATNEFAVALGDYSFATGKNTVAGMKGYYIKSIDLINKKIYLCNKKVLPTIDTVDNTDTSFETPAYAVGDSFNIINDNHYVLCATISAISNNIVTYNGDLGFTQIKQDDAIEGHTFSVPSKPLIGKVVITYGSFASGENCIAAGRSSEAIGRDNITAENYSHAEGRGTIASYGAHSEGYGTKAIANFSHAEGYESVVTGIHAHAEGDTTQAKGEASHAEGKNTITEGAYSHVEGYNTKAIGSCAHAEGDTTVAAGHYSHAEGLRTTAWGTRSHIEGLSDNILPGTITVDSTDDEIISEWESTKFALTKGNQSHVEGANNLALGSFSHAEGYYNMATNDSAHAEGENTKATAMCAHAEGHRTTASGTYSHSEGIYAKATNNASHAEGSNTTASGLYSHAEGGTTTASGDCSHAEGSTTTASGKYSHAEGRNATASGLYSHAEGIYAKATNNASHSEGSNTTASGLYSHAEGEASIASGARSHAEGSDTIASSAIQHVQGKCNIEDTENKYAHIVGNGTSNATCSNAHTLDWKGNAWYQGSVTSSGADYAEFFEWKDGNPDNEERVGLLVALDGELIKLANAGDDVLGIISSTAAVLGDNYECEWNGKYLTDDFGRIVYDTVEEFIEVPHVEGGNEGNVTETVETVSLGYFKHPRVNPEYDPEQTYVNRSDRPEWSAVGMLGKLYLRDDGTCEKNEYATVGSNGVATASIEKTNMRVLSRVNDNVVRVLLK